MSNGIYKIICKANSSTNWKPYTIEIGLATQWQGFEEQEEAEEFIEELIWRNKNYEYAIIDVTRLF